MADLAGTQNQSTRCIKDTHAEDYEQDRENIQGDRTHRDTPARYTKNTPVKPADTPKTSLLGQIIVL